MDAKSKELVYAYIRQTAKCLEVAHIPEVIGFTCFQFYYVEWQDEFAIVSNDNVLVSDSNTVIEQDDSGIGTAYGKLLIDPLDAAVYEWKFKIIGDWNTAKIGICAAENTPRVYEFCTPFSTEFYAASDRKLFTHRHSHDRGVNRWPYGSSRSWRDGQIVCMRLDFESNYGSLSFRECDDDDDDDDGAKWNAKSTHQFIPKQSARVDRKLRMAVTMIKEGTTVQLVSVRVS